ncbi:MAG: aminoglycoside 6-adenylyltransferase [Waddliaceae bacterium]
MIENKIISNICEWVESKEDVRAAILIGSRASNELSDELADYDISLFTRGNHEEIANDTWLSYIANHWVCVHETIQWKDEVIPTRLVIFDNGIKVDFAFYRTVTLLELSQMKSLPDEYNCGYKVLIDKDKVTDQMATPSMEAFQLSQPSQDEFEAVIKEFWFEAYHVAKYLKRGDLWVAKLRDRGMKDPFLLTMIRWNESAKHGWNYATHAQGKKMESWVSKATWRELHHCFSSFEAEDSWEALDKMIGLFRDLAKETGDLLNYPYKNELDKQISECIEKFEK